MKKLLIIGAAKPGESTKMLMKEAENKFEVDFVPVNNILLNLDDKKWRLTYDKKDLTDYDYCLPRIDANRAQHGFHVIRTMDMLNVNKPYSAQTVLIAHNKFYTLEQMKKAGVPIPKTYMVSSLKKANEVLKKVKYPIVIKLVDGFGGKGVVLSEDKSSALSVLETMKLMGRQVIIEEFLDSNGEDIRAFIVGGEIVAGMKRKAQKGDFRSNLFSGGKAYNYNIGGETKEVALKAAAASGSDIVAVDMLDTKEGPKVIEININPGIKGIQKVAHTNIAKRIVDFIEKQVK